MERAGDSNLINRRYLDSLLIEMRNIGGIEPDTSLSVLGQRFEMPVTTAALSHLKSEHGPGMVLLAEAAKAAGALMFCGMGSREELEAVTKTGARVVKIIKPYASDAEILDRIAHATRCGCLALGMDLDHSFDRFGGHDLVLGERMQPISFNRLTNFVKVSPLPFILKGVLGVRDALLAKQAGVKGIVVSHHHGIMDFAPPPLMQLPKIREAVGPDMLIFVDCGIASGADIYKALALGADMVSVGRALMPALKEQGAPGALEEICRLNRELKGYMARTAAHDLKSIDPDTIIRP